MRGTTACLNVETINEGGVPMTDEQERVKDKQDREAHEREQSGGDDHDEVSGGDEIAEAAGGDGGDAEAEATQTQDE